MTPDAFVRDAFRRLPDLSHLLAPRLKALHEGEQAIYVAESVAVCIMDWARGVEWEPDWDVVFGILDVICDALAALDEQEELALILTGTLACLDVPTRRYSADALARATPEFRQRMLDAPALISPFHRPDNDAR